MRNLTLLGRTAALQVGLLGMCLTTPLASLHGQTEVRRGDPTTAASRRKVILQVVNRHYTLGTNIQSVYLRLFSDGTAECHAVKFRRDDEDAVKEKHLQPQEFAEAKALLGQPGLRQVKGRYEFPRMVIDSWMEWDMRIRNSASVRHVTISFAHLANHVTYPPALGRLGCLILKVRHDVYGDGTDYYRQACGDSQPIDAEITIPDWTRLAAPR